MDEELRWDPEELEVKSAVEVTNSPNKKPQVSMFLLEFIAANDRNFCVREAGICNFLLPGSDIDADTGPEVVKFEGCS